MFEVRRPILNFLLLVLGVSLKLTPGIVNKGPGVSEVLPKEGLELRPSDWGCPVMALFILSPSEADTSAEKREVLLEPVA